MEVVGGGGVVLYICPVSIATGGPRGWSFYQLCFNYLQMSQLFDGIQGGCVRQEVQEDVAS